MTNAKNAEEDPLPCNAMECCVVRDDEPSPRESLVLSLNFRAQEPVLVTGVFFCRRQARIYRRETTKPRDWFTRFANAARRNSGPASAKI